jgi:hypothetical protein
MVQQSLVQNFSDQKDEGVHLPHAKRRKDHEAELHSSEFLGGESEVEERQVVVN